MHSNKAEYYQGCNLSVVILTRGKQESQIQLCVT